MMNIKQALDRLKSGGPELNAIADAIEAAMREKDEELDFLRSVKESRGRELDAKDAEIQRLTERVASAGDGLRGRDAAIGRLHEQVQDMIDASGQQCGCGYDKPGDVCLGHWPKYKKQQDEIERLNREIRYLRHYGNKDCTHMADQAREKGEMEDPA